MHKKILYIAPYREMTGYGNSARNYIEALNKQGHDVCIAPIYISATNYPEEYIDKEILPWRGITQRIMMWSYSIVILSIILMIIDSL